MPPVVISPNIDTTENLWISLSRPKFISCIDQYCGDIEINTLIGGDFRPFQKDITDLVNIDDKIAFLLPWKFESPFEVKVTIRKINSTDVLGYVIVPISTLIKKIDTFPEFELIDPVTNEPYTSPLYIGINVSQSYYHDVTRQKALACRFRGENIPKTGLFSGKPETCISLYRYDDKKLLYRGPVVWDNSDPYFPDFYIPHNLFFRDDQVDSNLNSNGLPKPYEDEFTKKQLDEKKVILAVENYDDKKKIFDGIVGIAEPTLLELWIKDTFELFEVKKDFQIGTKLKKATIEQVQVLCDPVPRVGQTFIGNPDVSLGLMVTLDMSKRQYTAMEIDRAVDIITNTICRLQHYTRQFDVFIDGYCHYNSHDHYMHGIAEIKTQGVDRTAWESDFRENLTAMMKTAPPPVSTEGPKAIFEHAISYAATLSGIEDNYHLVYNMNNRLVKDVVPLKKGHLFHLYIGQDKLTQHEKAQVTSALAGIHDKIRYNVIFVGITDQDKSWWAKYGQKWSYNGNTKSPYPLSRRITNGVEWKDDDGVGSGSECIKLFYNSFVHCLVGTKGLTYDDIIDDVKFDKIYFKNKEARAKSKDEYLSTLAAHPAIENLNLNE